MKMTQSSNVKAISENIKNYLKENPLPGATVTESGIGMMWVRLARYVIESQMMGYSLIFIGIALFLCVAFGSIRVGLLTMIPNIAPVLAVLGVMGYLGIYLDHLKMLLGTIAISIAVDDSIHLVTRFRRRFLQLGNYRNAMEAALRDVGPALVVTTMILLGAFSCYLFSSMQVITDFGLLLCLAIFAALIADLLFMPALIMLCKPFGNEFEPDVDTAIEEENSLLEKTA